MSLINSKLDFIKNKESTITMDNAGLSSSTHSEEFPGLAHCKLQRVINLKTDFVWPPYSPDLNPADFLWGHLKNVV